jgi:hypothetical protein
MPQSGRPYVPRTLKSRHVSCEGVESDAVDNLSDQQIDEVIGFLREKV